MSHAKLAETFDEWAENGHAESMESDHGNVVEQVVKEMGIRPGDQILDLGCGSGWATRLLARAAPGAGAVGIDVARRMIAHAEELHDLTSRARYEHGTFEELDFPDGKFERAFSMEALYYAVDLERALTELLRVLKPSGTADVVIDRFEESVHTKGWSDAIKLSMHFLSEAGWCAAFEAAGFSDVQAKRVIDSRGPGDEASFEPDAHCPDYKTRVELHEAGSLWIHAVKPA
jgi:arsenite methyltransferase